MGIPTLSTMFSNAFNLAPISQSPSGYHIQVQNTNTGQVLGYSTNNGNSYNTANTEVISATPVYTLNSGLGGSYTTGVTQYATTGTTAPPVAPQTPVAPITAPIDNYQQGGNNAGAAFIGGGNDTTTGIGGGLSNTTLLLIAAAAVLLIKK
jgi:hypothetical protein